MKFRQKELDTVDSNNRLLVLQGISAGIIKDIPEGFPCVRVVGENIASVLYDTEGEILAHQEEYNRWPDGRAYNWEKIRMLKKLHRRVIKLLGNRCVVCGTQGSEGYWGLLDAAHIAPHWRSWLNPMGFTVLCRQCHDKADHPPMTKQELRSRLESMALV